ncbi:MAG: patatin-like phospholipase family protein [Alphaproteobacteria bacterium]
MNWKDRLKFWEQSAEAPAPAPEPHRHMPGGTNYRAIRSHGLPRYPYPIRVDDGAPDRSDARFESSWAASGNTRYGQRPSKPLIGLALGGGGARGWAHIGVINELERHGIRPDIITGTSAGALAGGLYTAGLLDDLEDFARSISRRSMLRYMDIAFRGSSLIGGKRLSAMLDEKAGTMRIEKLNRRFVAVATELATGHEIWIRQGGLVPAMRASYAIPGVFSPEKVKGRWLIDGGLVNPVPVSTARAFGARLVIAVNLNADVFGMGSSRLSDDLDDQSIMHGSTTRRRHFSDGDLVERGRLRSLFGSDEDKPGMGTVLVASFNIMQDRLARNRLAGDPADVNIAPRIAHIGLSEFDKAEDAIARGREAVAPALPYIREALRVLS